MNKRSYFAVVTGILVLIALLLAGCIAPAANTAPSQEPAKAGQEEIGVYATNTGAFADLDPSSGYTNEQLVNANLYETLTFYNPLGSEKQIGPKLATSWETSADGLTWTFHLRDGVKFHDGTPFNAAAVKFSIERSTRIGQGAAYWFPVIKTIETPDDLTVDFKLDHPAPLDLIFANSYSAWIMSPTAVGEQGADWFAAGNDAGTGPYKIESYEPNERMVLTRFDDYWGGWEADQFDKVIFEVVPNQSTVEQMLRAGDADFTNAFGLIEENLPELAKVKSLRVLETPSYVQVFSYFNTLRPPTDNLLVRRALSYSFPYEAVLAASFNGHGTLANGSIPANMWGRDPSQPTYTFDLDKAAALLAQAGYPDGGFDLSYVLISDAPDDDLYADLWRPELAKLGINLKVESIPWSEAVARAQNDPPNSGNLYSMKNWPDVISPYSILSLLYHSEKKPFLNLSYYNNPEFDALIDDANVLSGIDREAAVKKFVQAQRMVVDNALALYMMDIPNVHVIASNITGYVDNPAYEDAVFWYDLRRQPQ